MPELLGDNFHLLQTFAESIRGDRTWPQSRDGNLFAVHRRAGCSGCHRWSHCPNDHLLFNVPGQTQKSGARSGNALALHLLAKERSLIPWQQMTQQLHSSAWHGLGCPAPSTPAADNQHEKRTHEQQPKQSCTEQSFIPGCATALLAGGSSIALQCTACLAKCPWEV